MVWAVLNKFCAQHFKIQQLYGLLTHISQTIQEAQDLLDTTGEVKKNPEATFSNGFLHVNKRAGWLAKTYIHL